MANLEAIRAKIQAGDRLGALADVVGVVRVEPHNTDAWMVMADLVDEPERKRECYRRVLVVDPSHLAAAQALAALEQEKEEAPSGQGGSPTEETNASKRALWMAVFAGAGLLLLVLMGWLIFGGRANQAETPGIPTARPPVDSVVEETPRPAAQATRVPLQTQTLGALTVTPQPEVVPSEEVTYYFAQDAALGCGQGGAETLLYTFEFEIRQAAYSPDGILTALTADQALWLVNCAEARFHPIAETWQIRPAEEAPAFEGSRYYPRYLDWTPDSRFLYFDTIRTSDLGSAVTDDLFRIELNTNEITQVLSAGQGGQPHVSPDGSRVAAAGQRSITLANADGSQAQQVLTYAEQPPAVWELDAPPLLWLPDSSAFLAVISMEAPLSEKYAKEYTVFLVAAADGRAQALGGFSVQSGELYLSPDGRYLIYREYEGEDAPVFAALSLVALDGSGRSWVAGGEKAQFAGWLPDSSGYLYVFENDRQLYLSSFGEQPDRLAVEDAFPQPFLGLEWLTQRDFVLVTGLGVYSGQVGGSLQVLAAGDPGNSRLLATGLR
ncbi:MAG: hypothetical protein JW987_01425 [Anaerolineaceae bacterium]|nr:hypothetical protein [Anaerolineaceae bacterium]